MFDLSGMKIVISRNPLGKSRFDSEKHLSDRGATVRPKVDAITSFVLTTDAEASKAVPTSKVAEAKKMFIPVVTDSEWRSLNSRGDLVRLLSKKGFNAPQAVSAQPANPDPEPKRTPITFAPADSPFTTCL